MSIPGLREALDDVDRRILDLVAQRQNIVAEIGRSKSRDGRPLRDYEREKTVIDQAVAHAETLGLDAAFVVDLMERLIHHSLATQERDAVASLDTVADASALVIGGAGKMGRWFVAFLRSKGYSVSIADPSAEPGPQNFATWQEAGVDYDLVLVASPLTLTDEILTGLAASRPRGLVIDISSIKTAAARGLERLRANGCRVASIHPMFGPDTDMLSGRHLIVVDTGDPADAEAAKSLFSGTMVETLDMSLDEHDRVVAFILGLSHALNIAFFTALARSGETAARLIRLSSTTFDAQLLVAAAVARENPDLYFDIQNANRHGLLALDSLCDAAATVREVVANGDRDAFTALMHEGQRYFAGRRREAAGGARARRKLGR